MDEDGIRFRQKRSLRRRAEDRLRSAAAAGAPERRDGGVDPEPECSQRMIHELQVHQIELEMQNDELRRTFQELEISRARYQDLYDFAPVAYFTLAADGTILEANLTASILLGIGRAELIHSPFDRFVFPDDRETFLQQRKAILATGEPSYCDMRMLRVKTAPFWASLKAASAKSYGGPDVLHVVVSDIDGRKKAAQERELLVAELQAALQRVKLLSGLLPICSWCKKVRDDQGYWNGIEQYLKRHSEAEFTHGICPDCRDKYFAGRGKENPGADSPGK